MKIYRATKDNIEKFNYLETLPYTYVVYYNDPKSKEIKIYYGSRYKNKCNPDDFFKIYFTSSKTINDIIQKEGFKNLTYEIRYLFPNDKVKCQNFEMHVIQKLRKNFPLMCLNKGAPGAYNNDLGPNKNKIVIHNKELNKQKMIKKDKMDYYLQNGYELGKLEVNKKVTIIHDNNGKCKHININYLDEYLNNGWIQGLTQEHKNKLKESAKLKWDKLTPDERKNISRSFTPEQIELHREKVLNSIWITNVKTQEMLRVKKDNLDEYLNNGWIIGQNDKTKETHRKRAHKMYYEENKPIPFHSKESIRKMTETKRKKFASGELISSMKGKFGEEHGHYGKEQTDFQKQKAREARQKNWIVVNPDGKTFKITNLRQFCKENNLSDSNMITVSQGKAKHHKGWKCYKDE